MSVADRQAQPAWQRARHADPHQLARIARRSLLKRRLSLGLRGGLSCAGLFTLCLAGILFALTYAFAVVMNGLPSLESLPALLNPPDGLLLQPTLLYDRTGQMELLSLDNPLAANRGFVSLDPGQPDYIPENMIHAILAASQPDFQRSPGYTLDGLLSGGHPTLAQRLVFNLLLSGEQPGLARALRERLLASQVVARYGQDKVLEWYLNSAAFGPQVYGLQSAAQAYFNKPVRQLSLAEAALLAALSELPDVEPAGLPALLVQRQQSVLQSMQTNGWINAAQAQAALNTAVVVRKAQPANNLAPAFTRLVLTQLHAALPGLNPGRGGLRILTTLDYHLQTQAECVASAELARLAGRNEPALDLQGNPCQAARLLPNQTGAAPVDSLSAAVVALDPQNGQVLALAGEPAGREFEVFDQPGRQAGTLLTPLMYLAALSRGFTSASLFWDVPGLSPAGSSVSGYHGPLRLRTALANDYVGPAGQLLAQLGRDSVISTAAQLGLNGDPASFSSALETSRLTLLDAAHLFGIFANQGAAAGQIIPGPETTQAASLSPAALLRVEQYDGRLLLDWSASQSRPLISNQLAYLLNNLLSDEAARWPSLGHPNSLEIGRLAAAKLGQTAEGQDGWALGYTPNLVIGAWLGTASSPSPTPLYQAAAALWHAVSQSSFQNRPAAEWQMPPGLTRLNVCDPSGMLPTNICPSVTSELFLNGTEPTQADTLYRSFQVNRESGRLATVFTPPEVIENRVYMVVPPEAAAWARQAGLPAPPSDYDLVFTQPTNPSAAISAPQLFSHVHGIVRFMGSANLEGFQYYRLLVGQGLNPQAWVQLGDDIKTPVQNGLLAEWDTSGLSGLYAVQLFVVRKDQRVERAITQVTVDNQPPSVQITYPAPGQVVKAGSSLVLQAAASDNLQLARLEFSLDGRLLSSLAQGPFNLAWQAQPGDHTLTAKATDLAGNSSQVSVTFTVK